MKISIEVIDAARTERGAWTRRQLAKWGVRWPPPHGWKRRLTMGLDPNSTNEPETKCSGRISEQEMERLAMKKLYQEKSGDYSY